jgi:hypothetical protein
VALANAFLDPSEGTVRKSSDTGWHRVSALCAGARTDRAERAAVGRRPLEPDRVMPA